MNFHNKGAQHMLHASAVAANRAIQPRIDLDSNKKSKLHTHSIYFLLKIFTDSPGQMREWISARLKFSGEELDGKSIDIN